MTKGTAAKGPFTRSRGLIVIVGVGAAGQDICLNKVLTVHFCQTLEQLVSGH